MNYEILSKRLPDYGDGIRLFIASIWPLYERKKIVNFDQMEYEETMLLIALTPGNVPQMNGKLYKMLEKVYKFV